MFFEEEKYNVGIFGEFVYLKPHSEKCPLEKTKDKVIPTLVY